LTTSATSAEYDLFQSGFDASWELDLWGKARRLREASRAEAQEAVLTRDAARISLSAEVARTYIRLRGAEARLAILHDNRQTILTGQHIAQRRLERGAATRFDAATAGTQLAAIDARLPLAEREAAENRNALALLAGLEPHGLDAMLARTNAMGEDTAPGLPAGLPSDLARQRPDIQAAEAALHAATARIGVARADFYPSVSLSGSLGLQSLALSDLPLWNARQFVVGPVLSLPIFQGGRLAGRLELAKAEQQVAALRYRATVLRAWHEIDDALETWRTADARLAATRAGVEQSRIAAHVSERRYGAGATGYVAVLVAQQARLDREAEWIEARTERAVALTALYKALGGGWTPPRHERGASGLGLASGDGVMRHFAGRDDGWPQRPRHRHHSGRFRRRARAGGR
jgi:NodT family efflux transporter outer membrane factor (OMF) lipoprotein